MDNVLLSAGDAEKYSGQYVILTASEGGEVAASGRTLTDALKEAAVRGVTDPILAYIPEKDSVFIYSASAQ